MAGYGVTLSTVAGIARELSQTDSNGFTNQKVLDYANLSMLKMRKLLIQKGIDAATVQETMGTITDAVGEYAYPTDIWLPKSMEINWWNPTAATTTANLNYVPVDKIDVSNLPYPASMGWLRQNLAYQTPMVDFRGDYFEIVPTPNAATWGGGANSTLSNAIRFWYYLQPTLYTDNTNLTDSLAYPESIDYHSFAKILSAHFDFSVGKISIDDLEKLIKVEVGHFIEMLQGRGVGVIRTKSVPMTGWEY